MKNIKTYIDYGKSFGMNVFLAKVVRKMTGSNTTRLGKWFAPCYDRIIIDFLMKRVVNKIDTQRIANRSTMQDQTPKIIWMMWWQGFDQAPEIVKMCISQICRQNKDCTIHFIDQHNYRDYVHISEKMVSKAQSGEISYAHLSDLIRCRLLARWGGVWMDATLFVTGPLDEGVFRTHFYSVNNGVVTGDPSYGRWTNFFMATPSGSPLFLFLVEFLETYFELFNQTIDYFITFYAMIIAGELFPDVKEWMESIPVNNRLCFHLCPMLNEDYTKGQDYFNSGTTIFKLSWHGGNWKYLWKDALLKEKDGRETIYGYMLRTCGVSGL